MRYDLVADMRYTLNSLVAELQILAHQLSDLPLLVARIFSLPPPLKGEELNPLSQISVQQHLGQNARMRAIEHFRHLFIQQQAESLSTRSAVRLPGVICLRTTLTDRQTLSETVMRINELKQQFEYFITVESGLSSADRFPFVHQHFPGLITLNAYRQISLIPAPDSVNFGWANKHVIKKVCQHEIIEQLERSLRAGRARAPWTKQQWAEKVQLELEAVRNLPARAQLKIKRPVKVQPIARIWRANISHQQQLACPSPIIVTCTPQQQVPKIGELLNYDEAQIQHRHLPAAQPLSLLIPRLWLWYQLPD